MNKYNRNSLKKKVYMGIMFVVLISIILTLPIWNITSIEVEGNNWYTDEEIVNLCEIKDKHILNISFEEVKNNLLKLPYIKEVAVKYVFPSHISIKILEREPLGYVPFMGTYLCLDEQGQVIEQTNKKEVSLPIIKGLDFSEYKVGEALPIQNEDYLLCSLQIIRSLKKYNYEKKVKIIDIYNLEQIHLYVDNLDVIIGNIGDFDKKLQWLIQTHEVYDMGVLDLSNIKNGQAILSPIT
ncbi:cell division protein FtsQ/DivIB [Cellulosilyticum sp. I15G10I2]|uniref:cell division protein FtsQ/DivIB n=1 Tax=Cellulosilyticum sp. I15G10I2 TaxID=1892843 RepID=UPI00085BE5FD|nr:FtsQ-type POTRA domain-containing protein [Cellulosilyticum sp. I15G10I2]